LLALFYFDRSLMVAGIVAVSTLILVPAGLWFRYTRWPSALIGTAMSGAQCAMLGYVLSGQRFWVGGSLGSLTGLVLSVLVYRKIFTAIEARRSGGNAEDPS
jgi:hypothetical protein